LGESRLFLSAKIWKTNAGCVLARDSAEKAWIPASAGMTGAGCGTLTSKAFWAEMLLGCW
jgi:hypothetical protein